MSSTSVPSRKRRNEEISERNLKPRQSNPNLDMNVLLPKLHALDIAIGGGNSVAGEMGVKLKKAKDSIPRVVVWGAQSSGKSSLLNNAFRLPLPTDTGMCTQCPIVLKFGPHYNDPYKFMVDDGKNVYPFETFEASTQAVRQHHPAGLARRVTIIVEIRHPEALIITDLPGVRTEPEYDDYFQSLRQSYLCQPMTEIFHIVQAMVDPATDASAKYLQSTGNPIIPVITHTDLWLEDPTKQVYLSTYAHRRLPYSASSIALVNNRKDREVEILTKMDLKLKFDLIYGSQSLESRIVDNLRKRTKEAIPVIAEALAHAQTALDVEFHNIGRQQPDFRELAGEFREVKCDQMKREFNESHTDLARDTNNSKQAITANNFKTYLKLVPKPEILANQMQEGSRNCLPGSEGWNAMIKKYSGQIVQSLLDNLINVFATKHAVVVHQAVARLFSKPYKSATENVEQMLLKSLADIVEEEVSELLDRLHEQLENVAELQYSADAMCTENYEVRLYLPIIVKALESLKAMKAPVTKIDEMLVNPEVFVRSLIHRNHPNPYLLNAEQAYNQMVTFWESKMVVLHDQIIEQIGRFEREVEKRIRGRIQMVSAEDLSELPKIVEHRAFLVKIEEIMIDIRGSM